MSTFEELRERHHLRVTHEIYRSRPRCRTCGKTYAVSDSKESLVGYCPLHDTKNQSEESKLGWFCVILQDCLALNFGLEFDEKKKPEQMTTVAQNWWYKRYMQLHDMCIVSLMLLSPDLFDYWRSDSSPVVIDKILELKFEPEDKYSCLQHCAFWIRTASGAEYVFDPTGVQFGASWALLSPLAEYLHRRVPSVTNQHFELNPLGTERFLPENIEARGKEKLYYN